MTTILFETNEKPIGHIIKLSDSSITISIGDDEITNKDIIKIMSDIIFSKMYVNKNILISLIETIKESLLETQIKSFYFFTYQQLTFKNKTNNGFTFELVHSGNQKIRALVEKNKLISNCINEIKDLIEQPPEIIYPEKLLDYIIKFSEVNNLKVLETYDEKRLAKEGFGGIISVGKGSHNPPTMAILEWSGSNPNDRPIVLVGKGITYDSGGYSIKSDDGMKDMKRDKTGVCIILGIMGLLARLNSKQRVIAILPMAENVVSSKSYKPDEIVHSYSKKTVEIFNTDAEGRIILMDGLALAQEYNPKMIFDIATLTGVGAFCGHYGALFTNDYDLAWKLQKIGEKVGDRFWVLPISEELLNDSRNTKLANVKNDGFRCYSTTTMGATFLRNFVPDNIPWVHIDLGQSYSLYERFNPKNSNSSNSLLMVLEFLLTLQ